MNLNITESHFYLHAYIIAGYCNDKHIKFIVVPAFDFPNKTVILHPVIRVNGQVVINRTLRKSYNIDDSDSLVQEMTEILSKEMFYEYCSSL